MVHGNSGMFNFTHMYIHHCILWHEWIIFCDVGYTCMVRVLAAMLWHWSLLLVMITLVMLPSQIRNSHSGDCFSLRSQPHDTMQDVAYIISIYRPQLIKMYVAMYISVFAGYGCVCFFEYSIEYSIVFNLWHGIFYRIFYNHSTYTFEYSIEYLITAYIHLRII